MLWRRAQAARTAAERDYRETAASLDKLVASTVGNLDLNRYAGHHQTVLETAREQELRARQSYPGGDNLRLALIDETLGRTSVMLGRSDQSLFYFGEAYQIFRNKFYINNNDHDATFRALAILISLADIDPSSSGPRASPWLGELGRQGNRLVASLCEGPRGLDAACLLSDARKRIADSLFRRGNPELGLRVLEDDRDMLETLPGPMKPVRRIIFARRATRSWLGMDPGDPAELRIVADRESRRPIVSPEPTLIYLAQLAAIRCGWACPGSPRISPRTEGVSDRDFAEDLVKTLGAELRAIGRDDSFLPAAALRLHGFASCLATCQRASDELPKALRTAGRLLALAIRVAELHPKNDKAHLLLSEAHAQQAKNAMRDHGKDPRIWLLRGVEAARRAVSLNPDDEECRVILERQRQRLEVFDRQPATVPSSSHPSR